MPISGEGMGFSDKSISSVFSDFKNTSQYGEVVDYGRNLIREAINDYRYRNRNNASGYNASGYNASGYNASGYNASGYNASGYNASGYNASGYNASTYCASGYNAATISEEEYVRMYINTRVDIDRSKITFKGAGYSAEARASYDIFKLFEGKDPLRYISFKGVVDLGLDGVLSAEYRAKNGKDDTANVTYTNSTRSHNVSLGYSGGNVSASFGYENDTNSFSAGVSTDKERYVNFAFSMYF